LLLPSFLFSQAASYIKNEQEINQQDQQQT